MGESPHIDAADTLTQITDPDLRAGLGRIFAYAQHAIDHDGVTVVVLTARRLACLYQALLRAGMPALVNCQVVTDRYFDTEPQRAWAQDRILILDDTVVVGSTLYALHRALVERAGHDRVTARTVCVDDDQHVPYLTKDLDLRALHHRGSDQVQAFSLQTVTALYRNQVPCFSDFSTTRPVRFTSEGWHRLLAQDRWHVADVTAPLIGDDTHRAYSLIPRTPDDLGTLPADLRDLIDVTKVRAYVRMEGGEVSVVFVPIALVRPCTPDRLADAARTLALRAGGSGPLLRCDSWRPEALHRLLQMYVSAVGLHAMWPTVINCANGVEPMGADTFEPLPLELYFGEAFESLRPAFSTVLVSLGDRDVTDEPRRMTSTLTILRTGS